MIQSGRGLGFPTKTFQCLRVFRQFLGQELQRDEPMQLDILGLIDHTHAAATELLQDAIVRDGLADHGDSFSGRDFAADLVEEIEDEADLVHRSGLFCARGLQHGEALAVGVQVKVIGAGPRSVNWPGDQSWGLSARKESPEAV